MDRPLGAIIFHTKGIAGSLNIGLLPLSPILIMHQMNYQNTSQKPNLLQYIEKYPSKTILDSDDWEIVSEKWLKSDEYEV